MGALRRLMHRAAQRIYRAQPQPESPAAPAEGRKVLGFEGEREGSESKRDVAPVVEESRFSFEMDWSVFTLEFWIQTFEEFVYSLAGLPLPADAARRQYFTVENGHWRSNLKLEELYKQQLREGLEPGFLVRGVIYDMGAIAIPFQELRKEEAGSKDWSNQIYDSLKNKSTDESMKLETVTAEQVIEKLGLKKEAGLKERIGGITLGSSALRKQQMVENEKLEELLGRGDSIRAKYADRLRHKQVLAEARREQGKLGISITTSPGDGSSSVMPGSPSLVRYLEERGVAQALLTRGADASIRNLLNQLGSFQFREMMRLENSPATGRETLSEGMLRSICMKWGLPSKQVLVVIGREDEIETEVLRTIADSGYFICRVENKPEQRQSSASERARKQELERRGAILSWFNQLAEGTLHVEHKPEPKSFIHFSVLDMTELKWVIEDLNGVSYRASTILRGFK